MNCRVIFCLALAVLTCEQTSRSEVVSSPSGQIRVTVETSGGLAYRVEAFGKVTPEHKCTIAFTRNLLGEMDFTPGGFLNRTRESFRPERPTQTQGTRAQELALLVIYESPILCVCDHPDHYRDQPGAEFLKLVPAVWDQTVGVNGQVGQFVTVAKRSGEVWMLGTITNWTARRHEIPLDFLDEGPYEATIWRDGPRAAKNADDLARETRTVTSKDRLALALAPGGGAVVRLVPKR